MLITGLETKRFSFADSLRPADSCHLCHQVTKRSGQQSEDGRLGREQSFRCREGGRKIHMTIDAMEQSNSPKQVSSGY